MGAISFEKQVKYVRQTRRPCSGKYLCCGSNYLCTGSSKQQRFHAQWHQRMCL